MYLGGLAGLLGDHLSQGGIGPASQGCQRSGLDNLALQVQAQAAGFAGLAVTREFEVKPKEKTIIQELQAEVDEWLSDID